MGETEGWRAVDHAEMLVSDTRTRIQGYELCCLLVAFWACSPHSDRTEVPFEIWMEAYYIL